MRLACVLLGLMLLLFQSGLFSQTVTWSGKNVPIEKVFAVIKKQTGYFFFYNNDMLSGARKITLNVKNAPLKEVLEKCFTGQPFTYEIENKTIVLAKKPGLESTNRSQTAAVLPELTRTVTGKVSNNAGAPLDGATVSVPGTHYAIATSTTGAFSIKVPHSKHELVISSIGFVEQRITISQLSGVNIILAEKDLTLGSDVVVVGYGTSKKVDLTGSVAQVNIKDLRDRQNPDLPTLIQGKISGVDVNAGSIRVRGVTSFNSTDPLVVVDGFLGGNLETLNPNDIQNIQVLKDASSSAIYGARGANGVILVTTTKPKAGAARIAVLLNSGVGVTPKKLEVLNASEYIDFVHESLTNANLSIPSKLLSDSVRMDVTYWQNEVFKTSRSNSVDVNISGGHANATYYVSIGYKKADEIYIGPSYELVTARFKNEFKAKKWLRFGDNLAVAYRIRRGAGPYQVINMITMQPYLPVKDAANYWGYSTVDRQNDLGDAINPVATSALNHPLSHTLDYLGNVWAELEPVKGLQFHLQFGVTGSFNRRTLWTDKYENSSRQTIDNSFSDNTSYTLNPVWESYLTYTQKIGNHDFTIMAGNARQNYSSSGSISIYGQGYSNTDVRLVYNAAYRSITGETMGRYAFESYFGRLNYQFANRYLLTVNLRRDGSPRFAPMNRWGTFPSLAIAWKLHEEKFLKSLDLIDQFKLRASIGLAGNDAIGDFRYLTQVFSNGVYYALGNPPAAIPGTTVVNDASQNIKWESTISRVLGLDMTLLRNKMNITAEYFIKNSKDILFGVPTPLSLGYGLGVTGGNAIVNAASCLNKGFEFQIGYRNSSGPLHYSIDANYTHVRNRVTSLGKGQPYIQGVSRTEINKPIGFFYGYTADGVFKNQAELDAANARARQAAINADPSLSDQQVAQVYYQLPATSPGDVRYKDINGDGLITDTEDRSMIGNSIPVNLYGLTVQLSYKQFDLNVFLNGITGSQLYYDAYEQTRSMKAILNQEKYALDRWKSEQEPGNGIVPRAIIGDPAQNSRISSLMVSSGNYLKIRQLSGGYSIPGKLATRMGFNSFRVYASGTNLLTFSKSLGYDPEFSGTNLGRGYTFLDFPLPRSFSIGLQAAL